MNITARLNHLDADGRFLADHLADRGGRPASDGATLRVTPGCAVCCRDLLTYGERARRFGTACPVPNLDRHIAAVERCYGPANAGRVWRPFRPEGWRAMTDAARVNALGAALRLYCAAGGFEPVPPKVDPFRERALAALFGSGAA